MNTFGKHGIIKEDLIVFTRNCGRTTDNGQRTKGDHKSSPCHYVIGELIRAMSGKKGGLVTSIILHVVMALSFQKLQQIGHLQ